MVFFGPRGFGEIVARIMLTASHSSFIMAHYLMISMFYIPAIDLYACPQNIFSKGRKPKTELI